MRLRSILASLAFACAACGGSTVIITDEAGSSDATKGSGDAAGADAGGTSGQSCNALRQQIAAVTLEATKCCPSCDEIQCARTAQGLCCPISVQSADKGEELTRLVNALKAACPYACPALPCPPVPSAKCDQSSSQCR